MKKCLSTVIFALISISLFAGGTQAATIYEKEGFTYSISGDFQIQFRQDVGVDQEVDVEYDDLELKNAVSYDLGNGLEAFGELDFSFDKAADSYDAPNLEESYLGLSYKMASVLVGKTDNAADEFGVYGGYETYLNDDAFDYVGFTSGDDLIRADIQLESLTIVLSHELEAKNEISANGTSSEIFVGAQFVGVQFGAAYQQYEEAEAEEAQVGIDPLEYDIYGVSVAYDATVVYVGVDYSIAEQDDNKMSQANVAVTVPIKTFAIGGGYSMQEFEYDSDDLEDEDFSSWYVNVAYKFPAQQNVKVFAEVADTDQDDTDIGYLAGIQLIF